MRLTYLVKNQPVRLIKIQPAPTGVGRSRSRSVSGDIVPTCE
jgi:hypothetical protein